MSDSNPGYHCPTLHTLWIHDQWILSNSRDLISIHFPPFTLKINWLNHSLLQGIFLTQGSNLGLLCCRQILYHLSHQGSPYNLLCRVKEVLTFLPSKANFQASQGSGFTCTWLSWSFMLLKWVFFFFSLHLSVLKRLVSYQFSSVQSLSCVQLFATPRTAARQASWSITNSWSLLKLVSIESVMPSNHLILCHPLLLLPSIFPSIRVLSNESVLRIR